MAEVTAWQARPLEPMYPVVFFDALRVKIREDAVVRNKAIYLALGVLPDGTRDILGLWIENTEGAKFWMKVFNDLKTRGVADILIAVTDGLKGIGEALGCGVPGHHAADLHRAPDPQQPGLRQLEGPQGAGRGTQADLHGPSAEAAAQAGRLRARPVGPEVPHRDRAWRRAWDRVIPFFAFPPAVRRVIYTTNAIESVHSAAAQDHQDARALPQRRRGHQADLAGAAQHHGRLGPRGQGLARGDEPVRDTLRRSIHGGGTAAS